MKREDKELLLKDLSARLVYDCKVAIATGGIDGLQWNNVTLNSYLLYQIEEEDSLEYVKPYLRPMSSMTEEEKEQIRDFWIDADVKTHATQLIDFYNKYHFDYRGLISKGLALEAPEGMYN